MWLLSSLWLRPGVILGEGLWTRLDRDCLAHVFVDPFAVGATRRLCGKSDRVFFIWQGQGCGVSPSVRAKAAQRVPTSFTLQAHCLFTTETIYEV